MATAGIVVAGGGVEDKSVQLEPGQAVVVTTRGEHAGEVAVVDGPTGRATSTHVVPETKPGSTLDVEYRDDGAYVIDRRTGKVYRLKADHLAAEVTFKTTPASTLDDIEFAVAGDIPYRIFLRTGELEPYDPARGYAIGEPIKLGAAIAPPIRDRDGSLRILQPSTGTLVTVHNKKVHRRDVQRSGDAMRLALTQKHFVVIDGTDAIFHPRDDERRDVRPVRIPSADVKIAPTSAADVIAVGDDGAHEVAVYGASGDRVGVVLPHVKFPLETAPLVTGHIAVVLDDAADEITMVDLAQRKIIRSDKVADGTTLQLKDGFIFVNDPGGDVHVIDGQGRSRAVDGARLPKPDKAPKPQPTTQPPPVPPPPTPTKPPARRPQPTRLGRPLPPIGFTGSSGDHAVVLRWFVGVSELNGAPSVDSFAVLARGVTSMDGGTCASAPPTTAVPGAASSTTIGGLTPGCEYDFGITMTTSGGTSDETRLGRPLPIVVEDVPSPPTAVVAEVLASQGVVNVRWSGASGEGVEVGGYDVVAHITGGPQCSTARDGAVVGRADTSATDGSASVTAGRCGSRAALVLGVSYTFSVVTRTIDGSTSDPSPRSSAVTPVAPPQLDVAPTAAATGRGAIRATWTCDALCWNGENDPAHQSFRFTVDEAPWKDTNVERLDATTFAKTFEGLSDEAAHTIMVMPVNRAGPGTGLAAQARTPGRPVVWITNIGINGRTVSISFQVDAKGSSVTGCEIELVGAAGAGAPCDGGTIDAPYWAVDHMAVAHATSAEFGRSSSAGAPARVGARPSRVIDSGVARVQNKDASCKPAECDSYVQTGHRFGAVCWATGFEYYRAGTNESLGYEDWWIRDEGGWWIQGLFTDADDGSGTPGFADGGAPWGDIRRC